MNDERSIRVPIWAITLVLTVLMALSGIIYSAGATLAKLDNEVHSLFDRFMYLEQRFNNLEDEERSFHRDRR